MMNDRDIIELYWQRAESAISETARRYGSYCRRIALNILGNDEDCEECLNDTWLKAWESIPPQRPQQLDAYLGRITRNLALDKYRRTAAQKRGSGQAEAALSELSTCLPAATPTPEQALSDTALAELLQRFVATLPDTPRRIFAQRYWYLYPIRDIAAANRCSESKVKMSLLRSRSKLRELLEKEGVSI